jgi:HPt (histidine-containing phosphotransfer) domain-containing protein
MFLENKAEEIGIDLDIYKTLINTFLKETLKDINNIEEDLKLLDYPRIAKHAHHIKGAARNLALDDISSIVLEIETESKNDKFNNDNLIKLKEKMNYLKTQV